MGRRGMAAVAVLVLALAVSPVQANPGVVIGVDLTRRTGTQLNQDLIGVDGPGPAGAATAMAAIGVRWVRTDVGFEHSYNCATRSWDPDDLDRRVAQVRAEGARPLLIVDYTPACLATTSVPGDNPSYYPPDLGANAGRWDRLVAQMAMHEITVGGVRDFEIWNEPDWLFWRGTLPGYLHLYQDTATVLERTARATGTPISVGGPALLFSDPLWIEPFLAFAVANHLPVDFLSWHYYANYPLLGPTGPIPAPPAGTPPLWYNPVLRAQIYGQQIALVKAEVARYRSLHPLLWLDEWNADAGYDARMSGPFDAAMAAAVLDSMQQAGLDRAAFFDVADDAGDKLANWGLLTAPDVRPPLQPKPVWWTFFFWHQMLPNVVPVTLSPDQSRADLFGRIGAIASTSDDGAVTVLTYNFLPYDPIGAGTSHISHTVTVDLTGLRAAGRYSWTRTVPGGAIAGRGTLTGPAAALTFTLPTEGVAFTTIRPAR